MQWISAHCSILSREIPYSSQSRIPLKYGKRGSHVLGGSSGYLLHSQDTHNHFAATDLQFSICINRVQGRENAKYWNINCGNMFGNHFSTCKNMDYGRMAAELHHLPKLRHLRPSQLRVAILPCWSRLASEFNKGLMPIHPNPSNSNQRPACRGRVIIWKKHKISIKKSLGERFFL